MQLTSIDIGRWLSSLSSEELDRMIPIVDKHESQGLSDTSIKAYGELIQQIAQLKDTWQTIDEQYFLKSL